MNWVFSILMLASPTLLILAAWAFLRHRETLFRRLLLMIVGAVWALALYFWVSYSGQTDDVGLMVQGILAYAVSGSAFVATVVAVFLTWRR